MRTRSSTLLLACIVLSVGGCENGGSSDDSGSRDGDSGGGMRVDASRSDDSSVGDGDGGDVSGDAGTRGGSLSGFVVIPSGTFTQGPNTWADTTISRTVTISRSFYLQATEVTQGQWRDLMGNNPSHSSSCGDSCPVERVSWWDALAYMNALSVQEGLQECYNLTGCSGEPGTGTYNCSSWTASRFVGLSCTGYRLPTEAEWEYAARAGTTTQTYNGDLDNTGCSIVLDPIAWYRCNSGDRTHVVGQKLPNAFGLYDMLGNVWEWTWDWYAPYTSTSVTDPLGPNTGSYRVSRGGCWNGLAGCAVAAFRNNNDPSDRNSLLGFRPARSF